MGRESAGLNALPPGGRRVTKSHISRSFPVRSLFAAGRFRAASVALIALAATILPAAAAAADLRCDLCREEVVGRYVVYDRDGSKVTVCDACDKKYPHCKACGMPFTETPVVVGGESLCPPCAKDVVTCGICDRVIRGAYTVFRSEGKEWKVCESCAATSPRCSACKRPLKTDEVVQTGDKILCRDCDETLPDCEACAQPIIGTRYMLRFRPGEFCEPCWEGRPVCSMCGAPCGDTHASLSDGRILCDRCDATAITSLVQIRQIYDTIKPILEKELGKPIRHNIALRLVGPDEIDKLPPQFKNPAGRGTAAGSLPPGMIDATASTAPTATGGTGTNGNIRRIGPDARRGSEYKELGKFVRVGNSFEIRILSGQPRDWAWETVAHELAHAWQSEYNPDLNDSAWEEGFAQWAAEIVLHDQGKDEQLERLRLRDDFYGQAYRIVNRYEALRGKEGVLHMVLTVRNLPR